MKLEIRGKLLEGRYDYWAKQKGMEKIRCSRQKKSRTKLLATFLVISTHI